MSDNQGQKQEGAVADDLVPIVERWVHCPLCDGRGRVPLRGTCGQCKGAGKVIIVIREQEHNER
jgi:DnaJ-class molecular chaperone